MMGMGLLFGDKNVLELVVMVAQTYEYTVLNMKCTELYTLNGKFYGMCILS